jgi:TonB family protein
VALPCAIALSIGAAPQDYRKFVGQQKQFCGRVVEYRDAFKRRCDIALLIGSRSTSWKFAAVVPKSARTALPRKPETYLLQDICVSGTVVEEKKKPYIKVETPEQLQNWKASEPFAPDAARECDGGAKLPKVLKEVKPQYSRAAMRAKVEGVVEVEVLIGADGSVADVRVVRELHPDLDASAARVVKEWQFTAPTVNGTPAPMAVLIELTFTLK